MPIVVCPTLCLIYLLTTHLPMTTISRILVFVLVWLVFAFVTLKSCIEPKCCGDRDGGTTEEVITPPPAPTDNYAIVSRLGDAAVLSGSKWPDLRSKLLAEYQADTTQLLDIYGHYYAGEPAPDGFENMGFYRANEIKKMLVPDVPADKINLLSRRLDGEQPAADELWKAGTFNWQAADDGDDGVDIIEIDDEIIIRFPFDSDVKDVDPAVDAYLLKLAERLEQTNERVSITGHTDNVDTDAYNMRLGQRRADFIKDILVKDGVDASRITTKSDGESNPVDTNSTSAGRHNNRRAVVKLMPQ